MSDYNYLSKIKHRNKLIHDMHNNNNIINNTTEWYKLYMPFLPQQILDIIPLIIKEKQQIIDLEESLTYLKYLFDDII
jgi:hypothetical protein